MKISDGSTLLFIGDSITHAGRNMDLGGEGRDDAAYGSGYVLLIKSMLDACHPQSRIRLVNQGISGNTIKDLESRWSSDVIARKPDWLSVMIGINDVWRQFDSPLQTERHVSPSVYASIYRKLLQQAKDELNLKGLVIASPYVLDTNRKDAMRHCMDEYSEIARQVAAEFEAIFVDTQTIFDRYLEHFHSNYLCWDRIHPSATGHMLIAQAWLASVGFVTQP